MSLQSLLEQYKDKPLYLDIDNRIISFTNFYGETDLLECPICKFNLGIYALVSPVATGQDFLEIAYECTYCGRMHFWLVEIPTIRERSEKQKEFILKLVNDVMVKHTRKEEENIVQRKKFDILKGQKSPSNK